MDHTVYTGLEAVPANESIRHTYYHSHDPIPEGLEVAPPTEGDKQVLQPEKEVVDATSQDKMLREDEEDMLHGNIQLSHGIKTGRPRDRKVCGLRFKLLLVLIVAGTVFVLGLAIGLGVGLSSKATSTPPPTRTDTSPPPDTTTPVEDILKIGGSLNTSYYTSKGAWNGTGLAFNWQRFSSDLPGQPQGRLNLVLYYQHYSGAIRWLYRTITSTWLRGPEDWEDVAVDAKNATPISAFHHTRNTTKMWEVFYIDQNNQVRQRSGNNLTTQWTEGPITQTNLTAHDGDLVGLHACYGGRNTTLIRLWYASDETTFEEYVYHEDEWKWQRSWENLSGAAGVGCYSWDSANNFIYAAFVNLENKLEIWYQSKADPEPSADWEKSEVVIADVHLASSVSLDSKSAVVQTVGDGNLVRVSKMTWNGRDTKTDHLQSFVLENRLRGTRLTAVSNETSTTDLIIFSQIEGDDVIESSRLVKDDWDKLERGTEDNILAS